MAVKHEACEHCGSQDNKVTFDNGSIYCFTTDCSFNKEGKRIANDETPKDLISGEYQPIANRRISQRTCEVFGYQIGEYNGQPCHIASIRNDLGKIVAQQIRLPNKQFLMTGNCSDLGLVGKHLWGNKGRSVVITEGYIDMLSIGEMQDCKWPVVTVPNGAASAVKAIKRDLAWLLNFDSIVLCFDNDEAGRKAVEDSVILFPPGRVKIAALSEKDANDVLIKGKGKELTNIVFTANEYRPDGIIMGHEIDFDELRKPKPRGLSLPYPILDEMIRGLKPGRIYTIYAGTGLGKSTCMREISLHLKEKYDMVVANIFLEESLAFTAESYIAMKYNIPGYRLEEDPKLLTDKQWAEGQEFIKNYAFYQHFGSLNNQRLFNLLDYLAVAKNVKVVFLDHISILISGLESSGEGERKDIDVLMTSLRSFCERTGVIIVDATQLKRKKGAYSEGEEINESDARGSGAIEHISDVVFSLNIDTTSDNPYDAQIKVIKNRITGQKGNADLISYNFNSGRYLPKAVTLSNLKESSTNTKTGLNQTFKGEML